MAYLRVFLYLLAGLLFALPLCILPPSISPEIALKSSWVRDERQPSVAGAQNSWVPLYMNDSLIYADSLGHVGPEVRKTFVLQYDSHGYYNSDQYHDLLVRKAPDGSIMRSVESRGFPLIDGEFFVVVDPDGLGIDVWDADAQRLFERRWATMVASVLPLSMKGRNLLLVGLLDGRIELLSSDGELLATWVDSVSSQFAIVYGLRQFSLEARSNEEVSRQFLFAITGYNPAFFKALELVEFADGQYRFQENASMELPVGIQSAVRMELSPNGSGALEIAVISDRQSLLLSYSEDAEQQGAVALLDGHLNVRDAYFADFESIPGLRLRSYSGNESYRLELLFGQGQQVMHATAAMDATFAVSGDTLFFRSAGKISAYELGWL